jgi:hypothetical protein
MITTISAKTWKMNSTGIFFLMSGRVLFLCVGADDGGPGVMPA